MQGVAELGVLQRHVPSQQRRPRRDQGRRGFEALLLCEAPSRCLEGGREDRGAEDAVLNVDDLFKPDGTLNPRFLTLM